MANKVYIIGSGGHAKVVIDSIEAEGQWQIAGLIDDYRAIGETTLSYKIIGGLAALKQIACQQTPINLIVAVGDNCSRSKIVTLIEKQALRVNFISVVHPKASVSQHATIAPGCVVMANASIAPAAQIGAHAIVNHNASVDHDCKLANFCSVSPGATLCGNVQLGQLSAIGAGATVIEKTTIGENCVIAANSVVINKIESNQVAIGCPAVARKTRKHGETYLK
ncbi:acetyltransferase [Shewanella halifaxensis]|uniref:acetyltransferase n=1 Tax=Shewanella halifaxensis TaxID=271098 RepID=UPI000D59F88E|nr:acetyltransferase [Shewanella halifaxensis]